MIRLGPILLGASLGLLLELLVPRVERGWERTRHPAEWPLYGALCGCAYLAVKDLCTWLLRRIGEGE
jgi:hypothetical protein